MHPKECFSLAKCVVAYAVIVCLAIPNLTAGQTTTIPLKDLSSFQQPGKSWVIAGDVFADLAKDNKLSTREGEGILVNNPSKRNKGEDLFTSFEHGDVDLELDYMMAKGSNSGIYLQGRYEIQLADSWGSTDRSAGSNGGIYERWDESRPKGQQGFQGYAPRQNVGRAPGLWQHLKISFQAPRFDASGNKTENAKLLLVELNGVPIHENVELTGPTRGAVSNEEVGTGPLRFQGDHGAVAFRNIKVTHYSRQRPELKNLTYTIYGGRYEKEPQYDSIPPEAEGPTGILTSNLKAQAKQYLVRYRGTFDAKEPGDYIFSISTPGGSGLVRINGKVVVPMTAQKSQGTVNLPAGEAPFELLYSRYRDWEQPALALQVSGPGLREFLISDKEAGLAEVVDPILVEVNERPVLRSFIDLPVDTGTYRVTHAISVGSPADLHYTYDMDHGALVQLWRGGFLDATPMWYERGDGSARAMGSVQNLGKPALIIAKLTSEQAAWVTDTTGSSFRHKNYRLTKNAEPTFTYQVWGATVQDAIRVLENGKGLRREVTIQNPAANLYARLAEGGVIEDAGKGLYLVDGKSYYVRVDDAGGAKPLVRNVGGRQELLVPVRERLVYSIIF